MMTINEYREDLALGYLLDQCDDVHLKNENDTDKQMSKLVDEAQNLERVSMTNVNTLLA
ncbi:MAG: hypothetical protein V7634_4791 [Bradyrhizobium sp.]|jgi:hypothetical protein